MKGIVVIVVVAALSLLSGIYYAGAYSQPQLNESEFVVRSDIVYKTVAGRQLHIDVIRPRHIKQPVPVVLCIHGGGWAAGNKRGMWGTAAGLARMGYEGVAVEYRFAPQSHFPDQIDDVKDAARYLRRHAGELMIDARRMGAIGHSAGGHLSLLLAESNLDDKSGFADASHPSVLKAAVSMAGPTDLCRHFAPDAEEILLKFLGATLQQKPELYKSASPICHLSRACAPLLFIHGDKDTLVPYDQATSMLEACRKKGVPAELVTVHNAGHACQGSQSENEASARKMATFFAKYLRQ